MTTYYEMFLSELERKLIKEALQTIESQSAAGVRALTPSEQTALKDLQDEFEKELS